MSDDAPEQIDMTSLPPDGYLQPKRYRITYRCSRCGHEYNRVTTKLDRKDPPCPKMECRVARALEEKELADFNMARMLEEQRPPGQLVQSNAIKAIDATAAMVMKDYGLTDLRDNIKPGEIAAPKLPPAQQRAADSFFSGAEVAKQAGGARLQARVKSLGAQAIAGAFRSGAVNPARINAAAGIQPGTPPLRLVRKEPAK